MNFFTTKLSILFILSFILLSTTPSSHAQIMIDPCTQHPSDPHCIDPVVLVPGLTTSFNIQTLFRDQPSDNWRFVPFGNIYQGLIDRLQDTGYTPGRKLFIAHYDWRQPNAESANEYLIPAIEEAKAISGKNKVDIIAHSMGGLVAREYIQGPNYQDDVDELIMLGTPNEGATDAYVAWEGGLMPDRWDTRNKMVHKYSRNGSKSNTRTKPPPPSLLPCFFSLTQRPTANNRLCEPRWITHYHRRSN